MFNKLFKKYIFLVMLVIFCHLSCYAAGYSFGYLQVIRDVFIGTFGSLLFLLLISFFSPKYAKKILLFYAVSMIIYFPIGWLYGSPTFKTIGSLLETDKYEALEFIITIPKFIWLLQLIFAIFSYFTYKSCYTVFIWSKNFTKKVKIYLFSIFSVFLVVPSLGSYISGADLQSDESFIPITIIGFYTDLAFAPKIYLERKNELLKFAEKPATWHIHSINPKYKNYVVVIGESVRSDYMNLYGFPLKNTPFLSNSNGIFIDGYISTAEITMSSVPSTLSLANQPNNNIISLAKEAGFSTSWISNQGMLGFFSATISSFALRSDYTYFTQRGDYQKSAAGIKDEKLLPEVEKILKKDTKSPRLIVLHLMGSHSDFCKRIDKISFDYKTKSLSCYVSSIKETDKLLSEIVDLLKNKNESYSLIYFSDHGLKHVGYGDELTLIHGGDTYESYAIPLVKISSDDTERKMIKTQRSAFNFLKGFSAWTGILTEELAIDNYDFFSLTPDLPSSKNNLEKINKLPKDPIAIDDTSSYR